MAVLGDKQVVAEGTLTQILSSNHPFIRYFFGGNRAKVRIEAMMEHKKDGK